MKIKKILIVVTILIIIILCPIKNVIAADNVGDLGDLSKYGQLREGTYELFSQKANVFVGIFQVVGSLIAVICIMVLGIKYMFGSIEQKAEYKKTLMPYVIGAVLIFATCNILGVIYDIATKNI